MIQKKQKDKDDTDVEEEETPATSRSRKEARKEFRERKKPSKGTDRSVSVVDSNGKFVDKASYKDTQVQQSKEWDQSKKDILTYLGVLIGGVEWFVKVKFHGISNKLRFIFIHEIYIRKC